MTDLRIQDRELSAERPPFIIAEACINHGGDLKVAEEMVYKAKAAGVDAIKFQMHCLDDEMLRDTPTSSNFSESLFDTLEKTELALDEHKRLKSLCDYLDIEYMCTPFSFKSADILEQHLDLNIYKIGSGECTNFPLLRHVASKGKPMIVSTGMTTVEDVELIVRELGKVAEGRFMITHCVSSYPCPYEDVNLGMIKEYKKYGIPIGLSDHSVGIYTSLGAVALGACLIEKHFTLDRTLEGPDHKSSIEPYELSELVKGCRAIWEARGSNRRVFEGEREIKMWANESVVTTKSITKGEKFSKENISVKRPAPKENHFPAREYDFVIGKTARADIPSDVQLKRGDVVK